MWCSYNFRPLYFIKVKPDLYISFFTWKFLLWLMAVHTLWIPSSAHGSSSLWKCYFCYILLFFVTLISLCLYLIYLISLYMICFVDLIFRTRTISIEFFTQGKTTVFFYKNQGKIGFFKVNIQGNGLFLWNIQGFLFQNCAMNPVGCSFSIWCSRVFNLNRRIAREL